MLIRNRVLRNAAFAICFAIGAAACASMSTPEPSATQPPKTETAISTEPPSGPVEVTYFGHSSILMVAPDGTRIICDPYKNDSGFGHPEGLKDLPNNLEADAVTISHFHPDHGNFEAVKGNPLLIMEIGTQTVGMVKITGFASDHGLTKGITGEPSSENTVFAFEIGKVKIVHLGAAGYVSQPDILQVLEKADLVIVDGVGDVTHPIADQISQLLDRHVGTILIGHFSIQDYTPYFGSKTLAELFALLPQSLKINDIQGSTLAISPGMPQQIAILKPFYSSEP